MTSTKNDKQDYVVDKMADLEAYACELVALAKSKQTNVTSVVWVNAEGEDEAVSVYGFYDYRVKSSDTLDKLAVSLLGSADYSTLLAYFNGIQNEGTLQSGTIIKIPYLADNTQSNNNQIYAEPSKQDNYGVDVSSENGELEVNNNDLITVSGKNNLHQAIENRLTTASSKRIRLSSYGIRSTIGEPMAIQSYLLASIEQTVKTDPRIAEVNSVKVRGDGDKLYIEIDYTDINSNQDTYLGEI